MKRILLGLSILTLVWAYGSILIFLYTLLHKSLNEWVVISAAVPVNFNFHLCLWILTRGVKMMLYT